VDGDRAEVEQHGGQRALVNCALRPDLKAGDYVLVDRGFIVEIIEAEEAAEIIRMYAEIEQLLEGADETVA
jgi:hydrogenase maturation factor